MFAKIRKLEEKEGGKRMRRGFEEVIMQGDVVWLKLAGKYHTSLNGQKVIIRPGDTFRAPADKFRNDPTWKLIEEKKEEVPKRQVPKEPEAKFRKILVGDGQFDVVRADGKPVNKKPLTEKEADALLDDK